jgi:Nucleotide modification associated domain 1
MVQFTIMNKTNEQFDHVIAICRDVFVKKMTDYGTAWRILRSKSMTDQIYIKAQRIRSIEEKGVSKIEEGARDEFIGIINYCSMALIQLELGPSDEELPAELTEQKYMQNLLKAKYLMTEKNHDYGEAWRQMRISSYTDLILMKIKRTKQIEDNLGVTMVSEGIDANYLDMINYAIFGLIKLEFE